MREFFMGFNHDVPLKLVVDWKALCLPREATGILLSCLACFNALFSSAVSPMRWGSVGAGASPLRHYSFFSGFGV